MSGANQAGTGGVARRAGEAGSTSTAASGGAAEGGAAPSECNPGLGFVGQLTGPGSPAPNGGVFTTDVNSVHYGDANLAGVVAAYPQGDEVKAIDVDVHDAVVTATAGATPGPDVSASRATFWIADEHVLLEVALDPQTGSGCCPDFDVRSGMRISFKATEVSTFIGLGRITRAASFVAGTRDSCVLVAEPKKIDDVDFYQMVRFSGQLGDSYGNDTSKFWHLGSSDTIIYDFLASDPSLKTGQTITFVGPVSPDVGYRTLVESNPAWVQAQD